MSLSSVIENHHALREILDTLHASGGHCYLVGGSVRDFLLGKFPSDLDIEVFGLPSQKIIHVLDSKFPVDFVGKSYGIIKIRNTNIDIGVPRKEKKIGPLHRDFYVEEDPNLPVQEAIKRRDFTINSIYYDTLNHTFVDPFHGQQDLENRVLRHTSEQFQEDPLRVLRGMQFCARFLLTPAPETVKLCQQLSPENLSAERIYQEFVKLLQKGEKPSLGLNFLKESHWIPYFPELNSLVGLQQDPRRHPEGDVFTHVGCVLDCFAKNRTGNPKDDLIVGFTLMCHDFGKSSTTFRDAKGIHSYWHEVTGIIPARQFLERMRVPKEIVQQVLVLTQHHMEPRRYFRRQANDSEFRKLSYRVGRLDLLALIGYCDCDGRVSNNDEIRDWMLNRIQSLGIEKAPPKALIQGRDLLPLGLSPNKDFSKILMKIYQAQLDGEFSTHEEGVEYVRRYISSDKVFL